MKSICIKNLRSLSDTGQMNLKPINILVGGNSSGKSTFLRLFPLMKQSMRTAINGPILWAGDDKDYVDFGDFKEAVNNRSEDKKIKFKFTMDLSNINGRWYSYKRNKQKIHNYLVKVEFSIAKCKDSSFDFITEIMIETFNYRIYMKFDESNDVEFVKINDRKYDIPKKDMRDRIFIGLRAAFFNLNTFNVSEFVYEKLQAIFTDNDLKNDEMYDDMSSLINYAFNKFILTSESYNEELDNKLNRIINKKSEDEFTSKFYDLLLMYHIPEIYEDISRYLNQYFREVYYIAPVRATAERYYRLRNIRVDAVDCRGENLAMFLNSLKDKRFKEFQKWTIDNLGFCVEKSLSEGHVSIKIRMDDSERSVNLSDTGFGYSQILPIITQIWYITTNENRYPIFGLDKIPVTIAIEQPELHLHPALQAKLVDAMVKIIEEGEKIKKNINFIIETHSKTMIERFGNLIYKQKVKNDKIAIFIFNKDSGDKDTKVEVGKFDKDGYLLDWPIGFFDPEEVI